MFPETKIINGGYGGVPSYYPEEFPEVRETHASADQFIHDSSGLASLISSLKGGLRSFIGMFGSGMGLGCNPSEIGAIPLTPAVPPPVAAKGETIAEKSPQKTDSAITKEEEDAKKCFDNFTEERIQLRKMTIEKKAQAADAYSAAMHYLDTKNPNFMTIRKLILEIQYHGVDVKTEIDKSFIRDDQAKRCWSIIYDSQERRLGKEKINFNPIWDFDRNDNRLISDFRDIQNMARNVVHRFNNTPGHGEDVPMHIFMKERYY